MAKKAINQGTLQSVKFRAGRVTGIQGNTNGEVRECFIKGVGSCKMIDVH